MIDSHSQTHHFYIHNDDEEKCSWLGGMKSASCKEEQNMVAYNSTVGVCYEAIKDISTGEELLVLFDKAFGGE